MQSKKPKSIGSLLSFQRPIKTHGTKFQLLLFLAIILQLLTGNVNAQTTTVSGQITDVITGEAIIGANIIVKGTIIGTISDKNGNFTLETSPEATLVVSFIGYLPEEVAIENQSVLEISLVQDLIGLEEIVVIGYGSMKKADLTGAVSTINEGDLVKTAAPNITSTLTGKMTGVITRQRSGRPGGDSPDFLIRGRSTYDPDKVGTNDPLVVIDGVERDFDRIDPNDIESITILKDAASGAIYGARGANGVILVTTKRGSNAKPQITFSTAYTSQKPTFRPEYMSAGEYAQYINEAYANIGQDSLFTAEEVQQFQDGTLPSTDWWGEMMNNSPPYTRPMYR